MKSSTFISTLAAIAAIGVSQLLPVQAQGGAGGGCIDFNQLAPGTIVSNQFDNASIRSADAEYPPMIFDSTNPTGGDFDLGSPHESHGGPGRGDGGAASNDKALGHVLIISEDGDSRDPDDKGDGGQLQVDFEFDIGVAITDVVVIDIEPVGSWLEVEQSDGITKAFGFAQMGDNGVETVAVNMGDIVGLTLNLSTSGAIAFVGCSVPEVATPTSTATIEATPTSTVAPTEPVVVSTLTATVVSTPTATSTATVTPVPSITPPPAPTEKSTSVPEPQTACQIIEVVIESETVTQYDDLCFSSPDVNIGNDATVTQWTGWSLTGLEFDNGYNAANSEHTLCITSVPANVCTIAIADIRQDATATALNPDGEPVPSAEIYLPMIQ